MPTNNFIQLLNELKRRKVFRVLAMYAATAFIIMEAGDIIGSNLVYFNSAHGRSSPVIAVKTDASGDITLGEGETENEGIQWSYPKGGSYMHTMLLYKGYLYNIRFNGQVQCLNAETGEEMYKEKIGKADLFINLLWHLFQRKWFFCCIAIDLWH